MFDKSAQLYDAIYAFKDYAAEAEQAHGLIHEHKRCPGRALLDVACGTGGHVAGLARHYDVEGLDLDGELLDVARRRHPEVIFHRADMVDFDLGRRFDAVVCLFGSVGYVRTLDRLRAAVGNMVRHLEVGGVLLLEPWLGPDVYEAGRPFAVFVDEPELKVARLNVTAVEGGCAVLDFHYLVATPQGIEHVRERHELGLFTDAQYRSALGDAGLEVHHDAEGFAGRGLYLGVRTAS
jgi:SAM-dependent methyltransferase